jgi:hypothetical protein
LLAARTIIIITTRVTPGTRLGWAATPEWMPVMLVVLVVPGPVALVVLGPVVLALVVLGPVVLALVGPVALVVLGPVVLALAALAALAVLAALAALAVLAVLAALVVLAALAALGAADTLADAIITTGADTNSESGWRAHEPATAQPPTPLRARLPTGRTWCAVDARGSERSGAKTRSARCRGVSRSRAAAARGFRAAKRGSAPTSHVEGRERRRPTLLLQSIVLDRMP